MKLSDTDKKVILAYAECDMNVCNTDRKLYMHRGTVDYHLDKVANNTEFNPRKFYDLVKLVYILKENEFDQ